MEGDDINEKREKHIGEDYLKDSICSSKEKCRLNMYILFLPVGKVTENASGKYTFTDTGLTSGKVYYYKIRCRSAYGDTYQYGTYVAPLSA